MRVYKCYFDGCCEPVNPNGTMGYGAYIVSENDEYKKSASLPAKRGNTNNIAEYLGLMMVLKLLTKKTDCIIKIYGDSNMVVRQMKGDWRIKEGAYKPYAIEAKKLFEEISKENMVSIDWIPRDENTVADDLSKAHLKKK